MPERVVRPGIALFAGPVGAARLSGCPGRIVRKARPWGTRPDKPEARHA